eukprot:s27_g9.t1
MEGDAGEITLQYVAVSSVEKLGEVLKRQCGTSKDFWFGTVASSEHQELASKLPGLHVGPFWAAEAFTHCYASLSGDPDADFAALTNRYGLGQRSKKPGRKCGAAGMIYLLLNQNGFSKLYKYNMELAAAPKAKVTKASKGDARKALGKRSKGSRASKAPQPIDAELILDEATSPQQKKSRTALVNDPLASPWPSSPRRRDPAESPRLHASNKHDLHRRQVAVIQKRLEELLPSLPLDQLSTSLALTKLEESMRKRKGKFDEFRADVERIIIAYVTKKSAAKAIAARKKRPVEEESAKTAISTSQAEHGNEDEEVPSTMSGPQTDPAEDLDVAEPKELRGAPEGGIPRAASQAGLPVQIDLETQELSDHEMLPDAEEMVEVDNWGFQVALNQLRECAGRPPSDAIAILTALLTSRPSEDLLSFGAWEAALGAHERMTSNRRVARLARKVKERWKAMDDAKKEQMLYRKALTAIEQLKTFGDADNAPSPES